MDSHQDLSPSQLISNQIAGLADWRGELLARLRQLINETAPGLLEGWKWDTAVWSQKGNVVSTCAFKDHVRLNFFKGASLQDPQGLFNAGLEAKSSRGINFFQGEKINEPALKELIHLAIAQNRLTGKTRS